MLCLDDLQLLSISLHLLNESRVNLALKLLSFGWVLLIRASLSRDGMLHNKNIIRNQRKIFYFVCGCIGQRMFSLVCIKAVSLYDVGFVSFLHSFRLYILLLHLSYIEIEKLDKIVSRCVRVWKTKSPANWSKCLLLVANFFRIIHTLKLVDWLKTVDWHELKAIVKSNKSKNSTPFHKIQIQNNILIQTHKNIGFHPNQFASNYSKCVCFSVC